MFAENTRTRICLHDEGERLVIPPIVSRMEAVTRTDVVQVRREISIRRLMRWRERIGVVI